MSAMESNGRSDAKTMKSMDCANEPNAFQPAGSSIRQIFHFLSIQSGAPAKIWGSSLGSQAPGYEVEAVLKERIGRQTCAFSMDR